MLTLENLHLSYGGAPLLRADWQMPARSKIAVIGPSGAGKSTLLHAIAGFLAPDAGRILWQGADITHVDPARRPVSMIFQDNNLFPHLTAFQNVALGLRPDLRLSPADEQQVREALARVGLAQFEQRKPRALSGGQQSRVALARVLVQARQMILLDEPFSALGPALRDEMLSLVGDVADALGASVLMVSHDIRDAQRFADQIIWLDGGIAAPPQPTAQILANPPEGLRAYLGR